MTASVPDTELPVVDLSTAPVGSDVLTAFALVQKDERTASNGNKYLTITLSNTLGQRISGKVWAEDLPHWADIDPGTAVKVSGQIATGYQGGPNEIKVRRVRAIEGGHPVLEAMNPRYSGDVNELVQRFEALKAQLSPGYKRFIDRFFEEACPWDDFILCPAAKGNHHAYLHGLLEHTVEVAELAASTAMAPKIREACNPDTVITGALVHDAGKIKEYTFRGAPIGMSPDAVLFNHMTTGPIMVMETWTRHREELQALGFNEVDAKHLVHIQVSHHGKREWGAVTEPATVAAQIVHNADMTSAHVRSAVTFIENNEPDRNGHVQGTKYGAFRHGLAIDPPVAPRPEARSQLGLDLEAEQPAAAGNDETPVAAEEPEFPERLDELFDGAAQATGAQAAEALEPMQMMARSAPASRAARARR